MTQKLIIEERPLVVMPSLITLIGIERAIILQQLHYACQQPNSGKVLDDGKKYVWNTYKDWQANYFPFWKVENIKKHFLKLEKDEFIVSCQPNLKNGDATKFYRINEEKLVLKTQQNNIVNQNTPPPQPELTMGATGVDNGGQPESTIYNKEQRLHTKTSYKEEREPQAEVVGKQIAYAVNESTTAEKEKFLTAIRSIYGAKVLADEWRWGGSIAKAIQNELTVKEYAAALRELLADKGRKFTITPENVLTLALQNRAKQKVVSDNAQPNKPVYESRSAEMEARGFPKMGVVGNA